MIILCGMTDDGNKRAREVYTFFFYIISANALRFVTDRPMWIGFMHPVSIVQGNIINGNQRIICL